MHSTNISIEWHFHSSCIISKLLSMYAIPAYTTPYAVISNRDNNCMCCWKTILIGRMHRQLWLPECLPLTSMCKLPTENIFANKRLTHLPLEKMAAFLADDIFNCIFLNWNDRIPIQMSLKYVPMSPIDNKPALVQVMAWCRTGDKPLPEPMMTHWRIYAALGGDGLNGTGAWINNYIPLFHVCPKHNTNFC